MAKSEPERETAQGARVTFICPEADAEKLQRIADGERSSVSQIVRRIVGRALDERYVDA